MDRNGGNQSKERMVTWAYGNDSHSRQLKSVDIVTETIREEVEYGDLTLHGVLWW